MCRRSVFHLFLWRVLVVRSCMCSLRVPARVVGLVGDLLEGTVSTLNRWGFPLFVMLTGHGCSGLGGDGGGEGLDHQSGSVRVSLGWFVG